MAPGRGAGRGHAHGRRVHGGRGPALPVHAHLVSRPTRSRRRPVDAYYAVHLTEAYWSEWARSAAPTRAYHDAVVRSLITLKALTYEPTGGIVAAATTSLPETLGGNRNWDYRYCWLRDATFTLEALMRGGYYDEAMAWRDWLLRAVAGDVTKLQIMYGAGGRAPPRRVGGRLAARLRGLGPGAHRQRRLRAVPARRLRRGHVGPLRVGPCRRRAQPGRLGPPDAADRLPRDGLARARRRHLGGPRAAPALHPLQGHGLGGRRPGGAHARGVARPRGPARRLARRCATRSHRGLREGLQRRRSAPSPSTTAPTSSTPACS